MKYFKKKINNLLSSSIEKYFSSKNYYYIQNSKFESNISQNSKLYEPYNINFSSVESYTYIASNCLISYTQIGKFCSIGPNLVCGYGIHPTNGISTSPSFYSNKMQNNFSLSKDCKIEERKKIVIGNDVFIGMNVSILDGVSIGDGAIIGAGAVVTKNVDPYSIIGGVPAKLIKYRFEKKIIDQLLKIKWWDWDNEKLKEVEKNFFNIEEFVEKYQIK